MRGQGTLEPMYVHISYYIHTRIYVRMYIWLLPEPCVLWHKDIEYVHIKTILRLLSGICTMEGSTNLGDGDVQPTSILQIWVIPYYSC